MIELDFTVIDLITENAKLKLEILNRDINGNEKVVIKYRRNLMTESDRREQACRDMSALQNMGMSCGFQMGVLLGYP